MSEVYQVQNYGRELCKFNFDGKDANKSESSAISVEVAEQAALSIQRFKTMPHEAPKEEKDTLYLNPKSPQSNKHEEFNASSSKGSSNLELSLMIEGED